MQVQKSHILLIEPKKRTYKHADLKTKVWNVHLRVFTYIFFGHLHCRDSVNVAYLGLFAKNQPRNKTYRQ